MTIQPDVQAPALNRRKVGDYVVTYLSDGFLDGSWGYLQGIEASEAEAMLEAAHRPPLAHFSIASYAIQGRGRTVLVDSGAGGFNGWGGRFPIALAAAGIEPADVDAVLLSHAHQDHIGGLTLHGKAVFPKAEVIINEADAKFWRDDSIKAQAGDFEFLFTQARLALDAYGDRVRLAAPGEVLPDIEMIALPGHTPAIPASTSRPVRTRCCSGPTSSTSRHPDRQAERDGRLRRRSRCRAGDPHEGAGQGGERQARGRGHALQHAGVPDDRARRPGLSQGRPAVDVGSSLNPSRTARASLSPSREEGGARRAAPKQKASGDHPEAFRYTGGRYRV